MSVSTTVANATESYCFPLHSYTMHAFTQRLLIAVSEWLNSSGLLWPFMRFQCPSVRLTVCPVIHPWAWSWISCDYQPFNVLEFFPVPIHTSGRQSIAASNSTCSSSQFICPSVQSLQIVVGVFSFLIYCHFSINQWNVPWPSVVGILSPPNAMLIGCLKSGVSFAFFHKRFFTLI